MPRDPRRLGRRRGVVGMGRLGVLLCGCLRAVGRELRLAGEHAAIAFYGRWLYHLAEPPPEPPAAGSDRPRPRAGTPPAASAQTVFELPPGHPERLRPDLPASPVERELWRQLADVALSAEDAGPGSPA